MSDYHNSNGYGDQHGDEGISSAEISHATADAFKHAAQGLNAEIGQNKRFLGVSMDAGVVDMLNGFYNVGTDFLSSSVRPRIRGLVAEHAQAILGVTPGAAKTAGVVVSIGSSVALKTAGYFGTLYGGFKTQRSELQDLTHKISPVLDDLKGNHSLAALYTTGAKDNEVIFAHRKRINKIADNRHLNNAINLGINSGTSLVLDLKSFSHEWHQRGAYTFVPLDTTRAHDAVVAADKGPAQNMELQALKSGAIGMLPQLAARIGATNDFKLKKELQPYSALEMILELSEQVNSNPQASGFTVPRSFQTPHSRREQYPLEEYLMRICIQHQKDMSYLDPKHSEIREALREDLAASIKPLAEAIRKGDFNVLGLVRMVGEGKIIKKQGRAIAAPAEVTALIEKEEPKQTQYTPIDPNEYYKDAAFSRAQFKSALKALEGKEKNDFAALFPDTVLAEAGLSKHEITAIRNATTAKYDRMISEIIVGFNEKSDDDLKHEGLAKSEIQQVRDAAEAIESQGEDAVHDLKTSVVNEHGIEHLLANVLVHQPKHLGKVMHEGHAKLEEQKPDDDGRKHAGRENDRRASGQYGHSSQLN